MPASIDPFSTATELLNALRDKQVSAVDLLDLYRERFERHNPTLNAIVDHDYDGARREAAEADAARASGDERPLLGLPITIKDTINVRGFRSTAGVLEWAERRPEADAVAVARLRAAGAVIMGKTNVPPYAADWQADNPVYGCTLNPWNMACTPGGSSGGAAAALASGMTALELGSDIGGSVRVPAAFCGVFGHKSSETALPRSGEVPGTPHPNLGNVLWIHGPLARGPEDLELAFDIVAGPDVDEEPGWRLHIRPARHERLADFRVAVLPPLDYAPVDADIWSAQQRLADELSRLGARVAVVAPDALDDPLGYVNLYSRILATQMEAPATDDAGRARAERLLATGDPLEMGVGAGMLATASQLYGWLGERELVRSSWRRFFREWDIALAPVTIGPAFPHTQAPVGERTITINGTAVPYFRQVVYPGVATLPGQPATAFPAGRTRTGLPIGLQAIGPYLEDRTPLRFVQLVVREFGGFERPPLFD